MWRSRGAGAALIMLLTVLAYLPAWRCGFIWDDDFYVTNNPLLTETDGLRRIWFSAHHQSQYFPLVYTTLRLERNLWGLNPIGYHVVNVLLHSMNALLVWLVLRRLALPGAWLAAAIWAVHPVNVESAAWITELKNTQSTLFYLLALLAWMKFADRETACPWRFYTLALLLQALALFSKPTACTLPRRCCSCSGCASSRLAGAGLSNSCRFWPWASPWVCCRYGGKLTWVITAKRGPVCHSAVWSGCSSPCAQCGSTRESSFDRPTWHSVTPAGRSTRMIRCNTCG